MTHISYLIATGYKFTTATLLTLYKKQTNKQKNTKEELAPFTESLYTSICTSRQTVSSVLPSWWG